MSQEQAMQITNTDRSMRSLYTIGGIAAILQLVTILGYSVAIGVLGAKPTNAEGFFIVYERSPLEMVLRGDFLLLVLIGLYLGTFPALFAALRRINPVYTALATLFTIMVVTSTFATEATFSLMHLAEQYVLTSSEAVRAQLVAAGEAVIASDMWNSSGAYMGGILLQGAGVMISIIMLRSKDFHILTAWTGILANGFDLFQHIVHPFAPEIAGAIQMFMGLFYFVWFPMLGWDLLRMGQSKSIAQEVNHD